MTDADVMRRCLVLARQAEGRTAPNPMVGCVIANAAGDIVAEAYHERAGGPHAEVAALARLGDGARGCTMYVNLEPCVHEGRTGPCAPAVADAGVARLVVGMRDRIDGHAGGVEWLRERGVAVDVGVLEEECRDLNRAFWTWATRGRPLFVLKSAISLDGKVATREGESQWITGEAARRDGHRLRNRLDAILVGHGTMTSDDPRLTVRGIDGGRDPIRVVVDSRLETPASARVLPASSGSPARVVIAAAAAAPERPDLEAAGAEIWRLPGQPDRVDLLALARRLGNEGVLSVLVEGGPTLFESLWSAGLVDDLVVYVAPVVFGGAGPAQAPGWVGGAGAAHLQDAWQLEFSGAPERLGPDLKLTLRPRDH